MARLVAEVDSNLPGLLPDQHAYPVTLIEASMPYLRNCLKENFRITPVFTMPLARRVMAPEGVTIAGKHVKQGVRKISFNVAIRPTPTSGLGLKATHVSRAVSSGPSSLTYHFAQTSIAVCNHALHHNPSIWGSDHNTFNPSRWDSPETNEKSRLLMHFGLGSRQCIGKTMAMTNIYKVMSTLLPEFEFELADEQERMDAMKGMYVGKLPELVSVGISDLEAPLMVRAKVRSRPLRCEEGSPLG